MTAAATGEAPLQDAVYVSSVNKIFGVSGVYLLQFNAVTGAREAQVRIASPVMGTARLVYHAATGMLYASVWNEPNLGNYSMSHPNKDVFPIDPATLAVGAGLGINALFFSEDFDSWRQPYWGPKWIGSSGTNLYVQWAHTDTDYHALLRINPANPTDRCTDVIDSFLKFQTEQIAITPSYVVAPNPYYGELEFGPKTWTVDAPWSYSAMGTEIPIACEWSDFDGLVYAVDGNGKLFRINVLSPGNYTTFDLTVAFPTANPCRLRYSFNDGLLYLPCMTRNSILIWNQTTHVAVERTGFENPIDLVEVTGATQKIFAVQNSPNESLKEVV